MQAYCNTPLLTFKRKNRRLKAIWFLILTMILLATMRLSKGCGFDRPYCHNNPIPVNYWG